MGFKGSDTRSNAWLNAYRALQNLLVKPVHVNRPYRAFAEVVEDSKMRAQGAGTAHYQRFI
jgi:hypothetical protein